MSLLNCVGLTAFLICLIIKMLLVINRKIRQHFIHKQCTYLCFKCKYRYECDDFLGGY